MTATTDKLSDIGRHNIENIKNLGIDYIEVSVNPKVRRRINKLALKQVGDISWPEHVTIFTIPVRLAVQLNVPLIVWGENSQHEYGGPAGAAQTDTLTRRWLEEFGGIKVDQARHLKELATSVRRLPRPLAPSSPGATLSVPDQAYGTLGAHRYRRSLDPRGSSDGRRVDRAAWRALEREPIVRLP